MYAFEPVKLGTILGRTERNRIIVPPFQRGYSWGAKHVRDFWTDINRFREESKLEGRPKTYFMGPVVWRIRADDRETDLLDGQQRLATTTILLAVMRDEARGFRDSVKAHALTRDIQRDLISKDDEDTTYALQLGEVDRDYFINAVQDPSGGPPPKATLRSHRAIAAARKQLQKHLQDLLRKFPTDNHRVALLRELFDVVRSDLIVAALGVKSEIEAFKVFETLNNRGLRLSAPDLLLNYMMSRADESQRPVIRRLWSEMLQQMKDKPLDRFLRHLWVSKYGDLKSTDLFTALKERIDEDHASVLEFAELCAEECGSYADIVGVTEGLGAAQDHIKSLVGLRLDAAYPLLLSTYRTGANDDELRKVAGWVLVYATRHSILSNLDSDDMEALLFSLARLVRSSTATRGKTLAAVRERLEAAAPPDDRIKLNAGAVEMSREAARYVMLKIATSLETKTNEKALGKATLEHIYPLNPEPNEWGGSDGQLELEPYTWTIGNLTMFGDRMNAKARNAEFEQKRDRYLASELELTKELATKYDHWGVDEITSRAQGLLSIAVKIWRFDNPSMA